MNRFIQLKMINRSENTEQFSNYNRSISFHCLLAFVILSFSLSFAQKSLTILNDKTQMIIHSQYSPLIDSITIKSRIPSQNSIFNVKIDTIDEDESKNVKSIRRSSKTLNKTILKQDGLIQILRTTTPSEQQIKENDKDTCLEKECIQAAGYISLSMDTKQTKPCDNFYQYVCGKWIQDHPFPKHLKSWSHFERVYFTIREDLIKQMINKNNEAPQHLNKLFDFFRGCVNADQRNTTGYDGLFTLFKQIGGWPMLEVEYSGDVSNQTTTVHSIEIHENSTVQNSDPQAKTFDIEESSIRFSPQTYSWENAYLTLAKKLNIFYFIGIEMIVDLLDTNKTIIKIGPPYKTTENIVNLQRNKRRAVDTSEREEALERSKKLVEKLRFRKDLSESYPDLIKHIEELFDLQERLESMAESQKPITQDDYKNQLMNASEIRHILGPKFNLIALVEKIYDQKISDNTELLVSDINYLTKLGPLLEETDKRILANYFAMNTAMTLAPHTTPEMVDMLVSRIFQKHEENVLPNICFEEASVFLPEMLGALFLTHQFANDSQWIDEVEKIASLLKESFVQRLNESHWMDDQTRMHALNKLYNMKVNIGRPEWFSDDKYMAQFTTMFENINQNNYFESVLIVAEASQSHILKEQVLRFNGGNKDSESEKNSNHQSFPTWPNHRAIIDVNAFYYFTTNAVYIPAVLMQYPFFMKELPKSILFGSIGMIIGHEMTHAFDNSGRLYDQSGALKNWWSNATITRFSEKTNCFVQQYNNLTFQSVKMNGYQTLAENIADNGGLREAYQAFQLYKKENKTACERLPGELAQFTPDQLFFISFANMWCTNTQPEAIEQNVKHNAHSPAPIRVLGSLANFQAFSEAFNCPSGSPMNPVKKCLLW